MGKITAIVKQLEFLNLFKTPRRFLNFQVTVAEEWVEKIAEGTEF